MNEEQWIHFITANIQLDQYQTFTGQGNNNRFSAINSEERFQFGDLRIETNNRTIVLEFDSGGGVTNFVKYWPFLSGLTNEQPTKPFVLIHIYDPSYPSHVGLWRYCHSLLPTLVVNSKFILINQDQQQRVLETIRSLLGAG